MSSNLFTFDTFPVLKYKEMIKVSMLCMMNEYVV